MLSRSDKDAEVYAECIEVRKRITAYSKMSTKNFTIIHTSFASV